MFNLRMVYLLLFVFSSCFVNSQTQDYYALRGTINSTVVNGPDWNMNISVTDETGVYDGTDVGIVDSWVIVQSTGSPLKKYQIAELIGTQFTSQITVRVVDVNSVGAPPSSGIQGVVEANSAGMLPEISGVSDAFNQAIVSHNLSIAGSGASISGFDLNFGDLRITEDGNEYTVDVDDLISLSPGNIIAPAVDGLLHALVTTENSLEGAGDGSAPVRLKGDLASPGNDKVYGTDDGGTRGWYDKVVGLISYDAGNGADVWATGTGVTFSKVPANGEYLFNVPANVLLVKAVVDGLNTDTDAGGELFVKAAYAGSPIFNQSIVDVLIPSLEVWDGSVGTVDRSNTRQVFDTHVYEVTEAAGGNSEVVFNNVSTVVPVPVFVFEWK